MVPASLGSAVALAYLVGAAIAAFLAFNWLNRNVSSTVANTFTYVAPVIALALSALVLGEQVTVLKAVAASLAIAGVALMMR
jgi:drug/metabolite transporter (DMT)-like permease